MTARSGTIGAPEYAALQRAMRVMLTPAAYPDFDAWRRDVRMITCELLGADNGMFVVRTKAATSIDSDLPRVQEYVPRSDPFDSRIRLWDRQVEQVVWNRPSLWGKFLPEMLRSSYYAEWVRPIRAFHTIGLSVIADTTNTLISLHLTREREREAGFGERGLMLLGLLEPAFRCGAATALWHFTIGEIGTGASRFPRRSPDRSPLTPREQEVASLLARRRTNAEVADVLGVSRGTAKRHTENVLAKLGLRSRREVEAVIGE